MCILMDKRLAVYLNNFLLLQSFLGLKCKNRLFFKKKVLKVVSIKFTFKWLQTGQSDLKNTKQLKFCLLLIFTHF